MTAQEAMERARKLGADAMIAHDEYLIASTFNRETAAEAKVAIYAAALIRAQIEILNETMRGPVDEICHRDIAAKLESALTELEGVKGNK